MKLKRKAAKSRCNIRGSRGKKEAIKKGKKHRRGNGRIASKEMGRNRKKKKESKEGSTERKEGRTICLCSIDV